MFYRCQLNENTVKHNYKFIVKMCLCFSLKGVLSGFYNKAEKAYYKPYPGREIWPLTLIHMRLLFVL